MPVVASDVVKGPDGYNIFKTRNKYDFVRVVREVLEHDGQAAVNNIGLNDADKLLEIYWKVIR